MKLMNLARQVEEILELTNLRSVLDTWSCEDLAALLTGAYIHELPADGAAATEFQKIIQHRGIVLNFPLGALARLGLARAYALQGDTANARKWYQDFLTLWKEADADVPILQQAKAEYAKLK